jgi:ATP-dependent DNA helicase RecG
LEQSIIDEMISSPQVSRSAIAKNLQISSETVKEYIEKLKQKGALRRVGSDRGGHWEVLVK